MSKLITAKIDVMKIKKSELFVGEKGTYLDLLIWLNDSPDQYGNDCSIQQKTKSKDDPKIYLGNGKYYIPKEEKNESKTSNPEPEDNDGLPF